ncbi:Rz1-like lysis system protein LysC [Pseudoalteromonas phenolica]|uniref:Rz1-like lysis system protein LysC n=1 Tax=Pseudoalteromonas phenolica TaxID=161398 RepID=UPI003851694F
MLKHGLILCCLILLAACTSGQKLQAVNNSVNGCPIVIPCRLPASKPITNESLSSEISIIEQAWHDCAAQVDMIIECQQRLKEQNNE